MNKVNDMANAQVQVTFVDNNSGGRNLYFSGHKFKVNRKRGEKVYWRCVKTGCPSHVVTSEDILQTAVREHNHDEIPFILMLDSFKSKLVYRAKTEMTPIPQIYEDELANLRKNHEVVPDNLLQHIPTFASIKTILYRQRHKTVPRLPRSRAEIILEDEWTMTDAGEQFLHKLEDGDPILILTTAKNTEKLCDADVIFADGTFYASPKLFEQIYSLHAEVQGHMFPLVYCLMPNRQEMTYVRTFDFIQELAHAQGCDLAPQTFQLDFEKSAHNAVHTVFPNTHLRGCLFHFAQCIWHRTQKAGLATDYSDDPEVKKFVRRAAALPLVPLDKVEDTWLEIIADSPQGDRVMEVMDYVTTTWIEGQWSPAMWNHFGNDGHRTNNHLEGWHHKLNQVVKKAHPNIYDMIRLLKREQSITEVKVSQLDGHWRQPPRKRKYRIIDARMRSLKEQLLGDELSTIEYTDHVADLLKLE